MTGTLHDAAFKGDVERLTEILAADPSQVHALGEDRAQPLHFAAWNEQCEVIELLLRHGADIHARGLWGMTPLHYACHYGADSKAILLLIDKGADIESKDELGCTPLFHAATGHSQSEEIAEILLQRGAKLDLNSAMRLGKADYVRSQLRTRPESVKEAPMPDCLLADAVVLILVKSRAQDETDADPSRGREQVLANQDILEALIAQQVPKTGKYCYSALVLAAQLPGTRIAEMLLAYGVETTREGGRRDDLLQAARFSPISAQMTQLFRRYGIG